MKITILTSGTRGDVQPYIAFGKALKARGYHVVLACPDNFKSWVETHGLKFFSVGVDMQTFLQQPEGKKVLSGNLFTLIKIWKRTIIPIIRQNLDAAWKAAKDADLIVYHPKAACAVDIAEKTGAKLVSTAPFPIFPTKAFPFFILKGNFGSGLNLLSYKPVDFSRLFLLKITNQWRKETLGIGKGPVLAPTNRNIKGSFIQLCMASSAVVPYPNDPEENITTTGFWFLEESTAWQPDSALTKFIESGEKPVYIGFGSMPTLDPVKLTKEIIEGVRLADVRVVLATGWGGLEAVNLPTNIFPINSAPHDGLFKHVRAVVHHGGAGTTAAGLRAGLPTHICPSAFDQPYWGRRVRSLSCGPRPQPLKKITANKFAQALIDLTTNKFYRRHAEGIAKMLANENGVERAVELIEEMFN